MLKRVTWNEGGAPKILASTKRVLRSVGADSLAIKRARKMVAPVADAFVAKLFDKSFGATPPGKPAPERSRTDASFKDTCFMRFPRSVVKRT